MKLKYWFIYYMDFTCQLHVYYDVYYMHNYMEHYMQYYMSLHTVYIYYMKNYTLLSETSNELLHTLSYVALHTIIWLHVIWRANYMQHCMDLHIFTRHMIRWLITWYNTCNYMNWRANYMLYYVDLQTFTRHIEWNIIVHYIIDDMILHKLAYYMCIT